MNMGFTETLDVPPPDYYDVLGCSPFSDPDQIHTEYRQRALLCHPDKERASNSSSCSCSTSTRAVVTENDSQWNRIREAYEVLGNPHTKAQYDRWRSARLPMSFTEWLKTSQAQSMHWSFDYQKTLPDATRQASGNEASSNGGRDIYKMFRNYEI
ncbi:DnaJ sub C member 12 [Coemansia sp. RSA 2559]|nr:DnaJ sub C member 12 [Coemansia sp. RSA 2559]KAJ2869779.1 DnaJ sub C member 12 [Coemansia erecta]